MLGESYIYIYKPIRESYYIFNVINIQINDV